MIHKKGQANPDAVQAMLDTIAHRGPDGEGLYTDGAVALGHRRLAIFDLRPEGNMPMHYEDRYTIVYNGEVYNHPELRQELEALGCTFNTRTDTEVILAAYDRWGEACVERFNGMWAFAIYDRQQEILFFSRDRFGVKPLYYWNTEDAFCFGSEIKEIWTQMPKPVKANIGVLLAFLNTGDLDYSEQTCFAEVMQLPGGCNMRYSLKTHTFTISRWYELKKNARTAASYEENVEKFQKLFHQAVSLRLRSDVPVGSTLSGGLDSSAIVCTISKTLPEDQKVRTLSSCFEEKKFDEQEYIDEVIRHVDAEAYKVWPDPSLNLDELDREIWHEDEPYTNMAGRFVYQKAHELGMTVMLVGEGADEQLAGYTNFFEALFLELLFSGRFGAFASQLKAYKTVREPHDHVSLKHLLQVTATDFLLPTRLRDLIRIHRKDYAAGRYMKKASLNHPEVYRARNLYTSASTEKVIKAYMFAEMPRILHALDRTSMAFSVETRAPFLDKDLVEAMFQMPLTHKLWDGVTKRVMRDAVREDMPEKITNRYGKMGFMSPEFQWFYENPELVTQCLADACDALSDYVDKEAVLEWCRTHANAPAKMGNDEWLLARLLRVGRWMKIFDVCA
ncbi:MAG: asparagine synthase (glutamine-hydrolyzing) [Clostridia bacterium]|nr:asparagine synthase (glutamine-hydrolyzing) [Clostridia bacterium]